MILFGFKRFSPRRKRVIITVASISAGLLFVAGYIFLSSSMWQSYEDSFENWQDDLKSDIDKAMAMPVQTADERVKKKAAFVSVSDEINTAQQSLCKVPVLISWQSKIAGLGRDVDACGHVVKSASKFEAKLQETTTYLDHEQQLTKALTTAVESSSKNVTEATWNSQIKIWQDADKAVAKIPSSKSLFTPVRTTAVDKVKGIEVAWTDVIAAHTAKDKIKYIEAQAKLATAYEALPSLASTSNQQFKTLAESLQSSYKELFKYKI